MQPVLVVRSKLLQAGSDLMSRLGRSCASVLVTKPVRPQGARLDQAFDFRPRLTRRVELRNDLRRQEGAGVIARRQIDGPTQPDGAAYGGQHLIDANEEFHVR